MTFESEYEIAMGTERNKNMTKNLLTGEKTKMGTYPSKTARDIMEVILPVWKVYFLEKNQGYGDMADVLGPAAQFVDIHRKVGKLKRALWDDEPIGDENVEEVLMDLIGHCFLALRLQKSGESDGKTQPK